MCLPKEIKMDSLYSKIRKLRIAQGLSQDDLAKMTGYTSRSSITKIEAGEVDLPQSKIEAFARALNTTPQYLLGFEDDVNVNEIHMNYVGDHKKNLEYFEDKPELLQLYKRITEDDKTRLIIDAVDKLEPEDIEMVLSIINRIGKSKESE